MGFKINIQQPIDFDIKFLSTCNFDKKFEVVVKFSEGQIKIDCSNYENMLIVKELFSTLQKA